MPWSAFKGHDICVWLPFSTPVCMVTTLHVNVLIHTLPNYIHILFVSGPTAEWATWKPLWRFDKTVLPMQELVSRGQTLFRTEGKGLGHGHRAVSGRPTLWSAYQSQHSIQSHDTLSMWLMENSNFSLCREQLEAWEVHWARSVLSHELQHSSRNSECRKVTSLTLAIAIGDIMTGQQDYEVSICNTP